MNIKKCKPSVVFATTLLIGSFVTVPSYAKHHAVLHHHAQLSGRISRMVSQADACMKESKYDQAEALYHDALNLNKDDISARVGLGMAYAKTFKLDRADEEFDKAIKIDPENPSLIRVRQ